MNKTQFTNEEFERERLYGISMLVAKDLLKKGIIDEADLNEIDTIFKQKYAPILGSL